MKRLLSTFRNTAFILTAILSGLCLFIALAGFNLRLTIANPDFHQQLFTKNSIYTQTQSTVKASLKGFLNNLKKYSPDDYKKNGAIFTALEKSITPEMVRTNIDSIREGIFQYFKGERRFLPDIYLDTFSKHIKLESEKQNPGDLPVSGSITPQALSRIDKINLSAILLYINRNDISDWLYIIKFIYYIISAVPLFMLPLLLLLGLSGVALGKRLIRISRWFAVTFLTCGLLSLAAGIALTICNHVIIPKAFYPLALSLPIESATTLSYIKDCITPASNFLIMPGIVLAALSAAIFMLPLLFPRIKSKMEQRDDTFRKVHPIAKRVIFASLYVLLVAVVVYRTGALKSDFDKNDFQAAISRIKNTSTITEVIPAKDQTIYNLNVILVDSKTEKPVTGVQVNVTGKSTILKKDFYVTSATDDTGTAKFVLDKGIFRVSFDSNHFPAEYQVPASFFFDLKSAGTTVLTTRADPVMGEDPHEWGIIEVEVLDKDNNPVSNLELELKGIILAEGYPNNIYSFTNSEGIAVFKVYKGDYKVVFSTSGFPQKYILPPPRNVSSAPESVSRYTLRLAEKKKVQTSRITPQPTQGGR